MKKALSLHIGLNQIDPAAYGNDGKLENCLNDCKAMTAIATANGFQATVMHDSEATASKVTAEIARAAGELDNGDYFLVTYAGHGSQIPDEDNEEADGMNETWVLYDRQMLDNELYRLWGSFKPGVRIFVTSDSCHSGTLMRHFLLQVQRDIELLPPISRRLPKRLLKKRASKKTSIEEVIRNVRTLAVKENNYTSGSNRALSGSQLKRLLPVGNSLVNYLENRDLYRNISLLAGDKRDVDVKASLLYISGCQDNQTSGDGPAGTNGVFTGNLLKVWNNGSFTGCYQDFYSRIIGLMPSDQSPNFMKLGKPDSEYEKEKPFTFKKTTSGTSTTPASSVSTPSMQVPSQINKNDALPTFKINTGGNPLYYVELATDKALFNRAQNGSNRAAHNFYATYEDRSITTATDFLLSNTDFNLPAHAWENLKAASKIYYRVGSAADTKWNNFKPSFGDAAFDSAPSFDLVTNGATPAPTPTPSDAPAAPAADGSVTISASVGTNGVNKKEDVKTIQTLLNKVPADEGGPEVKLVIDGDCGTKTKNAIINFQMYWGFDNSSEYKLVKPGSGTLEQLSTFASRSVVSAPVVIDKTQLQ